MKKQVNLRTRSFLHSPSSENGSSAIQGERATSPFCILRDWEERGVTTPNILREDSSVEVENTNQITPLNPTPTQHQITTALRSQ